MNSAHASGAHARLRTFLLSQIRMSHAYQLVMLKVLLLQGGRASLRDIAAAFLALDEANLSTTRRSPSECQGRF